VLPEPGDHEGGTGQQIGQVVQFVHGSIEGLKFDSIGSLDSLLCPSFFTLEGIHPCYEFGIGTGANVFADDAAVDLYRTRVVAALVPAHFMLPPRACPAFSLA